MQGKKAAELFPKAAVLASSLGNKDMTLPTRRLDVDFAAFSVVESEPLMCYPNAPLDFEQITIPHRGASLSIREVIAFGKLV